MRNLFAVEDSELENEWDVVLPDPSKDHSCYQIEGPFRKLDNAESWASDLNLATYRWLYHSDLIKAVRTFRGMLSRDKGELGITRMDGTPMTNQQLEVMGAVRKIIDTELDALARLAASQ